MAAALAMAEVERIEKKYSRYDQESTLSIINRAAGGGGTVTLDDETALLVEFAFACHEKSGGLFDITAGVLRRAWNFGSEKLPGADAVDALLPLIGMDKVVWQPPCLSFAVAGMELDFGGIGKEYAVDRLATLLAGEGVTHGLIDLGGDLFALGPHPDGEPWRIGLRNPINPAAAVREIALVRGALATSGDYERCIQADGRRYSHILNPITGWPVEGLASVTVLAARCMAAGSATTIAMLKGKGGIQWLADLGAPHHWLDEAGRQGGNLPIEWTCEDRGRRD
jgi:thiamine biosynthesis lipoprotein